MKRFELLNALVVVTVVSIVATTPTDELSYLAGTLTLTIMLGGYFLSMHW